jgi:Disulphide bond corrector protein DsbC
MAVVVFPKIDMKLSLRLSVFLWMMLLIANGASCSSTSGEPILLTSFTENYVSVSIYLDRSSSRTYFLSATYTPPDGYHLYSKDIPSNGINGLGRPTLLELTTASQIQAMGELSASVQADEPDFEPKELRVYPVGAVTLSLPIELPPGADWINDELKITYMACSASQCKPPVVGKIVSVRIPGADAIKQ